jgi:hypothetical protein
MKPTDALISKFIQARNSACFGRFLCPSSGVIDCTFGTGTCYTGLTTGCVQDVKEFRTRINLEISASVGFYCKEICYDARSYERKIEHSFIFANNGIVNSSVLVSIRSYPATESRSAPQNNQSLVLNSGPPEYKALSRIVW